MSTAQPTEPNNDSYIAPAASLTPPDGRTQAPAFSSTLQLLALCPLLAISDTVVKAVGFSIVVLILLPLSTLLFGVIRRWLDVTISLAASMLIAAGLVTATELLLRGWFHDLGASFTVFLPLLAVNVIMIDHALEAPIGLGRALNRSVRISIGIALTLIALGLARELVGRGSLLNGAGALLGSWAQRFEIKVFSVDMGFLLAMLPPGAFISLGLLIATRNWLARRTR
jgi:Na+-translocating ferredoxin:NAD+ oxidoreductase subunit E